MQNKDEALGTQPIGKLMLSLALPAVAAQFINMLYNIVDRIYIGNIPGTGALALTGVGVTFPIILLVSAFAAFAGMGGAPLASIQLGAGNREGAEKILGNCFSMLLVLSVTLTVIFSIFKTPLLYMQLAPPTPSSAMRRTISPFTWRVLFSYSLLWASNTFISAQGHATVAMLSVLIGAVINIVLDPVFIFVFGMGVSGAALATILSQAVSAAWVLRFLFSAKSGIRIRRGNMKFEKRVVGKVIGLGIAPFIMQSTESLVNITLNAGLQRYGGDLYVGSMTIMQSVMQMLVMPIQGITQGAQPIMSYNYGAKNYSRVRKTFSLLLKVMLLVTVSGFALAALLPGVLARMFTQDAELIEIVKKMMPIFFGGIWAFGAQMACQTTFMALGQAKISLFLALLRKVVLLVPLALLLPVVMGGNVLGIYIAEPVADVIASFTTLSLFLIKRKTLLPDGGAPAKSK
ncbi:MAG: MATE family efflux transporter [Ruthenibacterium lactatiformans]